MALTVVASSMIIRQGPDGADDDPDPGRTEVMGSGSHGQGAAAGDIGRTVMGISGWAGSSVAKVTTPVHRPATSPAGFTVTVMGADAPGARVPG